MPPPPNESLTKQFINKKKLGGEDARRHSLLRLRKFDLFRKIVDILSLVKRNILISPLEGEKKFLSELCELRNFREGYTLKYSCRNCNFDRRLYFLKNINCDSDMLHHDKNNKGRLGILAQREAGFEPSPAFVMLTGVRKRLLPLTKREGSDSVISNNYSDTNHSQLTTHYSLIPDMVFSRFTSHFSHKRTAFTLAEVLITIGIIGIVAALTIPAIIANTQGKEYEVARKRMLQTFGEGVRLISIQGEMQSANNAEDFVENYLKKQIKIMKTCDNDNLKACGIETGTNAIKAWSDKKITRTMPRTTSQLNSGIASGHTMKNPTKSYGFVMANGYAVNLFYNPNCEAKKLLSGFANWTSDYVCVNAIYDMNGLKGPNQAGKDIGFVTILYPDTTSIALAPNPYYKNLKNANYKDGMAECAELGADYTLPRLEEWASISYNRELFEFDYGGSYWLAPGTGFSVSSWGGYISAYGQNNTFNIRCVKR